MPQSARLTQNDFRRVFRILGDARDLRHDLAAQERRIVDGLCKLLGAPMGWATSFNNFRPGANTAITRLVPGAVACPITLGCLADWGAMDDYQGDPLVKAGRHSTCRTDVIARSGLMSYEDLSDYPIFEHFARPAKIYDSVALWFREINSDAIRGYALHRCSGEKDFSAKAIALARVFAVELAMLHDQGQLTPVAPLTHPAALNKLPPRLRRLVPYLLTGMSQKQVAREMGLSYHTVRSYTKELYDCLRVGSREAFTAKLRESNLIKDNP